MERKFGAKKFFIYGVKKFIKNDHKSLSKMYTPSIRELLIEYLEIHEDISKNLELDKLNNARNELIEAMIYYIKDNILMGSPYEKELTLLIKQLKEVNSKKDKERILHLSKVYNVCNSLIKKLDSDNIYYHIINLVKQYDNFANVDRAIHFTINELLYDGYSLRYLDSWYNEQIGSTKLDVANIDSILEKFYALKKPRQSFKYYISVYDNEYFISDKLFIDFNLCLFKQEFSTLSLVDSSTNKEIKNYLQEKSEYKLCMIETKAMDYYKGLDNVAQSITSYFQMINYLSDNKQNLMLDKAVCCVPDGTYIKLRMETNDSDILFAKIETRERQDIEDFILYRDKVFSATIKSQEIFNIQRALNIVKNQHSQSQENRIINLWAVLEYVLTFNEAGGSIISKVKDIVPKIVCLYIAKDKINTFWGRLSEYRSGNIPTIVTEFYNCKKDGDDYQYDLSKLIAFIIEKGSSLINDFEFNDNLKREIAEIGLFLSNPKSLHEYIKDRNQEVTHDLVRIYRARNVLIHSGRETKADLNSKSLRLYAYNNSLLGLIIYYMCKNPRATITEILNSINYTFENYMESLEQNTLEPIEIFKPNYLFIG